MTSRVEQWTEVVNGELLDYFGVDDPCGDPACAECDYSALSARVASALEALAHLEIERLTAQRDIARSEAALLRKTQRKKKGGW